MAHYKINSVRLSDLGEVGDVIELSEEEYAKTNYKSKLSRVEGTPTKKNTKSKKEEPVDEEQEDKE